MLLFKNLTAVQSQPEAKCSQHVLMRESLMDGLKGWGSLFILYNK